MLRGALVGILAFVVTGAHCGSRMWERPLKHQLSESNAVPHLTPAGFADNNTVVKKRWASMIPQKGPSKYRVWPDRTIRYCFEDDNARNILLERFLLAIELWFDAGLNSLVYHLEEVSRATCTRELSTVLVISYNTAGRLSSSNGVPSLDAKHPDYLGPVTHLSDRTDVGMLNVVANIAHEIGHIWGLYHEHENPNFWDWPGKIPRPDAPFSWDRFNCKNLQGYFEAWARTPEDRRHELCMSRNSADEFGFAAVEYIPRAPHTYKAPMGFTVADVDWDSIMLYPSGAGGIGYAQPGYDLREPILLKPDLSKIEINLQPTRQDVRGIDEMYNDISFESGRPVLLTQRQHKWHEKFMERFRKTKNC